MKEILLTNDDGYEASGLLALKNALKGVANVTIVAPSTQKSACAHSITLSRPLRFIQIEDNFYKLDDGTPSDCVYLALETLFHGKKPDLIVSGINHGANLGEDITYSGTCAAAMEGTLQGVPSLASSLYYKNGVASDFDLACEVTLSVVKMIFERGFPLFGREFLNLNIPAVSKNDYKGIKIVRAGNRIYTTKAQLGRDPRGFEYYWLGEPSVDHLNSPDEKCDLNAIFSGFASLTPVKLDLTAYESLKGLEKWSK